MRERQIQKINKKNLKDKYSSIELENLAEEIKEYTTLLKSIGFDIEDNDKRKKKKTKIDERQSKKSRKNKK